MEKFEELSQEKQRRIIDAGMEVFGRYEYKKANTEDIAAKAGISKGLLFYYFKDKKSFYMYLFQYMHEKLSCQETLNLENIMKDFEEWKVMFKKMAYKKEYQ